MSDRIRVTGLIWMEAMNNSIKRYQNLFTCTTLSALFISLVSFSISVWFSHYLPFLVHMRYSSIASWVLLGSSCILLTALMLSKIVFPYRALIFIAMILEGVVWISFPPDRLISTVTSKGTSYYLTSKKTILTDTPSYYIYQCNTNTATLLCNITNLYHDSYLEPNFHLVVDETTGDIYVMEPYDQPYYKLGKQSYYFEWENSVQTKNFNYQLYKYEANNINIYVLSRCDLGNWETCKTDLHHPIVGYRFVDILGNEYSENLYMLVGEGDNNIFRIYNDDTYTYEILASGIFGYSTDASIWGLVGVQKEGYYEYLLYEILGYLDFAPFHYTTTKKEEAKFIYDNSTKLLNIMINNQRVYSIDIRWRLYDYKPVCYVKNCEIK